MLVQINKNKDILVMKNYTNLNRLYDSHNEDDMVIGTTGDFGDVEIKQDFATPGWLSAKDMPGWKELMSMTVQEVLDKVGSLDTRGDAEYEVLEEALKAVCPKICSGSYDSDTDLDSPDSVEVDDEKGDIPTELEDTASQLPVWSEDDDDEDLENFEF